MEGTRRGSHLQVLGPRGNAGQDETWEGPSGPPRSTRRAPGRHRASPTPRPVQGELGALPGQGSQREELLPAGGDGVQGAQQEPPPAAATQVGARLGPPAPAPLSGTGRSASAHDPRPCPLRLKSGPWARASRLVSGPDVSPQTVGGQGPGSSWTRTHSGTGTHTWRRVRQWRRITASVRRATVRAAFSSAPRGPPATAPRRVRPREAMDTRMLCSWEGREEFGALEEPYGEAQGGWRAWVGAPPPYLLSAAGGSHPSPASGGHGPRLIFPDEMKMPGARPAPCRPWPSPPQGSLQVLADDSLVVAEHVRDAAGAGPGRAWRGSQQRQQERPECGPGGHLKGHQVRAGHPGPWRGWSPLQ